MMEFIQRRLLAVVVSLAVGAASLPAYADMSADIDPDNERPSATAMFGDAVIARPMLLALTALGTATFVVTLPFSALGGNTGEAARKLVIGPAKSTFLRCLGCTESQNRWKHVNVDGTPVAASADSTAQ
ncbi:MAG TPA: hypothetical protein VFV15_05535 [Moraxellaceae bacterium]|nr:hypothetical protein [Moraxellaceae bacterium]